MIPVFRWFLENVPCSLLSGSMPWLFSPTSASPLGFVRSSLFFFYTSYLPILLLIIILYRKIYVITVIKGVQNGILNGKREKNQEKWRESPYILLYLKGKKERKYRKSKLLTRFRYIFLTNSFIFSFLLLISYRFLILKKEKGKKMSYLNTKISNYVSFIPILRKKCPFLSVLSLFLGSRCVFPCVFCIVFLCLKRN